MAQVRVPKNAEALLPFCRPWVAQLPTACFSTYADLMMFAAGVGFQKLDGKLPPQCQLFVEEKQPHPIDFSVFKSPGQQLYPLVLLLGLASIKSHNAVRDEERLVRIVENYAAIGFDELRRKLAASTPEHFHVELAEQLLEAAQARAT
jgi:dnd system-associated protein 4